MAEPLPDWKDREFAPSTLPDNGDLTYTEPAGVLPPALPGMSTDTDEFAYGEPASSPRLNLAAEKVGSALGSTVGSVRSRLRIVGGRSVDLRKAADPAGLTEQASKKASELADAASEKLSALKGTATSTATEWKQTANARLSEWQSSARRQIRVARHRAAYYKNEYPVQTMLSLAGFAVVVGCALRIWRANSD
jgi:ElaB/YqjD/DUF883 family membrane-anchored ribosome-binding protein